LEEDFDSGFRERDLQGGSHDKNVQLLEGRYVLYHSFIEIRIRHHSTPKELYRSGGTCVANDPDSYAGGSVAAARASHAGQVEGDDPDKKG
jgi:hypothetical protein